MPIELVKIEPQPKSAQRAFFKKQTMAGTLSQHPTQLLRLLPSGPDRVHNLSPLWRLTAIAERL